MDFALIAMVWEVDGFGSEILVERLRTNPEVLSDSGRRLAFVLRSDEVDADYVQRGLDYWDRVIADDGPPERSTPTPASSRPSHCHTCGGQVAQNRIQCDMCLPEVREEQTRQAHTRLQQLRNDNSDPAHGSEAAAKRGHSVSVNNRASQEWNRNNERIDHETFTSQILPLLHDVPLSVMVEVTGLSKGYCSFIKRGIKIPHERHWDSLRCLVSARGT